MASLRYLVVSAEFSFCPIFLTSSPGNSMLTEFRQPVFPALRLATRFGYLLKGGYKHMRFLHGEKPSHKPCQKMGKDRAIALSTHVSRHGSLGYSGIIRQCA
jgi:hypothetical protein